MARKKLKLEQRLRDFRSREERPDDKTAYEYLVKQVVNSAIPNVLEVLTTEQVDRYCEDDDWEVTIS